MTVFKSFFKVARGYTPIIMLYVVVFLVVMYISFTVGETPGAESYKDQGTDMCIINHDDNEISDSLVKYLDKKHNLVTLEENEDIFRDAIYNRTVTYILIIPKGFGDSLLAGDNKISLESYKLPGSMNADFVEMDMNTYLSTFSSYLSLDYSSSKAYDATLKTMEKKTDATVYQEDVVRFSKAHKFYKYYPYIIISIIITGLAPILIRFNQEDLKKRTLCSRVSILRRNLILTIGSGIYTIFIVVCIVALSFVLAGKDMMSATAPLHIANATLYAFVCLALAFLISTITNKTNVLNMVANVIGLGSSFLCGVFVPRELLSDAVCAIGKFLPAYWYINVESEIAGSTFTWNQAMTTGFLVQGLYFIAIMVIAVLVGQVRRTK